MALEDGEYVSWSEVVPGDIGTEVDEHAAVQQEGYYYRETSGLHLRAEPAIISKVLPTQIEKLLAADRRR
jgi:hypothetical protein